ncbi:anti-sigma factor [Actinophytocola sediminis]
MNSRPTAEVHTLTGAYVLDAVTDDERAEFERHLTDCEACAQEVLEFRETTTRLGLAAAAVPPPELRASVLARIREVRQLPGDSPVPRTDPVPLPIRPRWTRVATSLSVAAAAVLLVVTVALGVMLASERESNEDTANQIEAMTEILRAGDVQMTKEGDPSGAQMTVLASRSADRALLLAEQLPDAPDGRDYQAWTIGNDVRPAGLVNPDHGRASLSVDDLQAVNQLAITLEPDGGSDQPTTTPIMEFDLS